MPIRTLWELESLALASLTAFQNTMRPVGKRDGSGGGCGQPAIVFGACPAPRLQCRASPLTGQNLPSPPP
jgi:hypothetical protein